MRGSKRASPINGPRITQPIARPNNGRMSLMRNSTPVKTPPFKSKYVPIKKKESLLNDPEMQELREKNWEKQDFSEMDEEKINKFIDYLKEYASNSAFNGDFQSAKHAAFLTEQCKKALIKIVEEESKQIDDDVPYEPINEKYDKYLVEIEQKYDERFESLQRKHERELEKFDNLWSEEKVVRYRKPSARILQMTAILKNLIEAGEFDRAEAVDHELKKLQEEETQESQKTLINDYENALHRMKQTQKQEYDQILLFKQKEIDVVESQRATELTHAENRNKVLEKKREDAARKKTKLISTQPVRFSVEQRTILLDLKPPNDPSIKAEEEKRRKEQAKRNQAIHKRNLAELERYRYVEPPPEENPPEQKKKTFPKKKQTPRDQQQNEENKAEEKENKPQANDDELYEDDERPNYVDVNTTTEEEQTYPTQSKAMEDNHDENGNPIEGKENDIDEEHEKAKQVELKLSEVIDDTINKKEEENDSKANDEKEEDKHNEGEIKEEKQNAEDSKEDQTNENHENENQENKNDEQQSENSNDINPSENQENQINKDDKTQDENQIKQDDVLNEESEEKQEKNENEK